jgi:hypothetical protein
MNPLQKKLRNQSILGILFLALFITSNAQTKPINKFYLQAGVGASTHSGGFGDISLQAIIKNKWSATLSYQSITMDPKNLPSDYQAETGYLFFIPYTYRETIDMNIVSLTAGRNFKLGKNVWATAQGGPSHVSGEKINFQRTEVVSGNYLIVASTSSNYRSFTEKKSTIGLSMRADLNWAFASFMGLGCGVFTNINSIQSPVGAQVKLIIGYMGREKKHK